MSLFTLDPRSRQPIYEQLKEQIVRYISLNVLQPGDRMPSVRMLARDLGINPNTVVKTYQELEEEGILVTEPKRGFFVSGREVHKVLQQKLKLQLQEAVQSCQESGISEVDKGGFMKFTMRGINHVKSGKLLQKI